MPALFPQLTAFPYNRENWPPKAFNNGLLWGLGTASEAAVAEAAVGSVGLEA